MTVKDRWTCPLCDAVCRSVGYTGFLLLWGFCVFGWHLHYSVDDLILQTKDPPVLFVAPGRMTWLLDLGWVTYFMTLIASVPTIGPMEALPVPAPSIPAVPSPPRTPKKTPSNQDRSSSPSQSSDDDDHIPGSYKGPSLYEYLGDEDQTKKTASPKIPLSAFHPNYIPLSPALPSAPQSTISRTPLSIPAKPGTIKRSSPQSIPAPLQLYPQRERLPPAVLNTWIVPWVGLCDTSFAKGGGV